MYLLERMSIRCLLDSLQDGFVHSEWDCSQQDEQWQVGDYADDRKEGNGQEDNQSGSENGSRLFDITPVDERFHCE